MHLVYVDDVPGVAVLAGHGVAVLPVLAIVLIVLFLQETKKAKGCSEVSER